ncbi:MAG: hypothetical protein QXD45_05935 [Candidatus Bathyarchaeia archaeon]
MSSLKCPECGGAVIKDGATGEVACSQCGVTIDDFEFVQSYIHRNGNNRGSFAVAGIPETGKPSYFEILRYGNQRYLHMLGRDNSKERTVTRVALHISNLANKVGAHKQVEEEAMLLAKRLLKALRMQRKKMSTDEVAAVAFWVACKIHDVLITIEDYEGMCARTFPNWRSADGHVTKSLLRLISKASDVEYLPLKLLELKDYVRRLAAKLRRKARSERLKTSRYIDALEAYAMLVCDKVKDRVKAKNPVCIAATAIRVADEFLGGWIGATRIAKVLGAGFSKQALLEMKKNPPDIPIYMLDTFLKFIEKRVAEVIADEVVRSVANRQR